MINCDANIGFKMISDAESDEQIIDLANSLSLQRWGQELDSLDLGDSMGAFIRAAFEDFYAGDIDSIFLGNGFFVRVDIKFDLFNWNR